MVTLAMGGKDGWFSRQRTQLGQKPRALGQCWLGGAWQGGWQREGLERSPEEPAWRLQDS
jgi:hypothetical protein